MDTRRGFSQLQIVFIQPKNEEFFKLVRIRPTMDQPQKPISTTDGKQTAGHSFSTRPKAKRTSLYDEDSSDSKAQQPPLNRQERQGSQKACNSAKIRNNDTTDSDSVIDTNTIDKFNPGEIALQNNLVLETLFGYMNRSDLLSFRVVSKQWQDDATKELRRRKLVIRFSFQSHKYQWSRSRVVRNIWRRLSKCRTPSMLSSFQVKIDSEIDLGNAGVTSFFTAVGNHLKTLTLHLNLRRFSFDRSSLMTHLQNLLCRHAPNLEFVEINFDFPCYRWADELQALDSPDRPQTDDNKFQLLPNLKTFIVDGSPPPKFFADVMNAAVNLRSVGGVWSTASFVKWDTTADGVVTSFGGFSSACLKYFLGAEGRDKIHRLKSFKVYLLNYSEVQTDGLGIELIGMFLTEHKRNLKLENFECVSRLFGYSYASFTPQIVGVINQILECSAGSLLKLRIEPAKWFEDLLIVPRLPKLQEICFDCDWSSIEWRYEGGCPCFFPRWFNTNKSFPNILSIVFLKCATSFFRMFVSRMETEMTEPMQSVRRLIMIDMEMDCGRVSSLPSDFHHIFPNLVSVSYVDVDKRQYYNI